MTGSIPEAATTPLDKRPEAIRAMFGRVAPAYDLLNHLLSGSLDRHWRRRAARALEPSPAFADTAVTPRPAGAAAPAAVAPGSRDLPALDLCCGTGDQAVALQRRGARVAAADFCLPMVALARRKFRRLRSNEPAPLVGDALALPFPAGAFRAATVSFGLRNVVDLDAALVELRRVLVPGGQLLVLEFALPRWAPLRALYLFYFRRLLPLVGRLVSGDGSAYSYLPSSVLQFPQRQGFLDRMATAGFTAAAWDDLSAGIVCLYSGRAA
jgi:demethylmenaquinone methyltransferase / 2-methoxy-6-polyprenyl-1,4-benzoquinol methylase